MQLFFMVIGHVPLDLGDDIKDERLRDLYKEKEGINVNLILLIVKNFLCS